MNKFKEIVMKVLDFVTIKSEEPLDNYNESTREWSKGHRKMADDTKKLIEEEIARRGD